MKLILIGLGVFEGFNTRRRRVLGVGMMSEVGF